MELLYFLIILEELVPLDKLNKLNLHGGRRILLVFSDFKIESKNCRSFISFLLRMISACDVNIRTSNL